MARGRSRTQLPESDQPPHLGLGQGQQTLSGYSTTVNGTVALGRSSNLECIIYLLLELGIRVLPRRRSGRHPWAVGSGFDTGKHIELFYWKTSVFAGKTTSLVRGDLPGGSPSGSPLGSSVPGQRVLGRETG
jgi:hypothetical protein